MGAASAFGIAPGRSRQLWTRISMVFPARLRALHLLVVVFVHGLTACPRSRGLTGDRGQAVRPRTKTTSRRCSARRRAGKTIEIRVQNCLERPEAIPEAEAAPHEVPRLHAETARASTPEDIISASGIAPGRSRQLWMRIRWSFHCGWRCCVSSSPSFCNVWPAAGLGRSFYIGAVAGALHCSRSQ